MKVIGWTDSYLSQYKTTEFTKEHRRALVDCIKKRQYNFNYADHLMLCYCAPLYDDDKLCVLTKQQWDSVMNEAYRDAVRGPRIVPMDAIDRLPEAGVLYEDEKYEPKGGEQNG